MTPFQEFFGRFATFTGRTSKDSFWVTIGVMGIANLLLLAALSAATSSTPEEPSLAVSLVMLASWVPWAALGVRRLHDINRSGWWMLLSFTGIGLIPLVWWHLIVGGTWGPNRFGEDPLGRMAPSLATAPTNEPKMDESVQSSSAAMAELKELGQLRDRGVLTEEEFAGQKARLLSSI